MRLALTRPVSPSLGDCELTFRTRIPIDAVRAAAQHATSVGVTSGWNCTPTTWARRYT